MQSEEIIKFENISKRFCRDLKRSLWYGIKDIFGELNIKKRGGEYLRADEFWSLKNISFELKRGESLGLIGKNGAGKSTLLKLAAGLFKPDSGTIKVKGRVGALIELGAGFNPILTGRENIYCNAAILGFSKGDVDKIFDRIIDFSGIEKFIDSPVQSYSSGMRVRLGYAIAAHLNPDVLLVDEVLAVGDIGFQRKCLHHMQSYIRKGGSLVLVAHNMHLIQSMCNRALLLDQGNVKSIGNTAAAISLYLELQHSQLR